MARSLPASIDLDQISSNGQTMWLMFALSAPGPWAVSAHIDKYLVERFFKNDSVISLMIFTALIGPLPLPVIAAFDPNIVCVPPSAVLVIVVAR